MAGEDSGGLGAVPSGRVDGNAIGEPRAGAGWGGAGNESVAGAAISVGDSVGSPAVVILWRGTPSVT